MASFQEKVFSICVRIPGGKLSTYSDIAKALRRPKASRAVGNALNKNRSSRVPCHRVVRSDGSVGGFAYGTRKKISMLRKEGIRISKGKIVDFEKHLKRS